MLKNQLSTILGLVFASVAVVSFAALPPKYLRIKDFKLCLATQQIKTYRTWCMPSEKPDSCPATSWEQLKAFTGSDKVPDCASPPRLATPKPEDKPNP
jgi:hypothetical protein